MALEVYEVENCNAGLVIRWRTESGDGETVIYQTQKGIEVDTGQMGEGHFREVLKALADEANII